MRLREIRIEFQRRLERVPRLLVHSHLAIVRAQRIVQHGEIRRLLLPGLQPQVCQLQRFRQLLGLLGDLLGRVLLGRVGRLEPLKARLEIRAPRLQRALLLLQDLLAGLQGPRSGVGFFQDLGQLLDLLGEPPGRGLLGRIDRLQLPRRRVELRVLGLQLAPLLLRRLLVFLQGLHPGLRLLQGLGQLLRLPSEPFGRRLLGGIGRLKPPEREVELCVGEVGDHHTTDEQAKGDRTDQNRPPDLSRFRCGHAAFGHAGLGQAVFDHAVFGHSSLVPSFSSFFSSCFSSWFRVPVPVTPTDSPPEMIVGVRKKMSSVLALRSSLDRKRAPRKGMSPKTGSFFSAPIFSSFMSPAMTRVVPSLTITVVSALEVSTMGILLPAAVVRERLTELTSGLIFMLTKPSSLMVGSPLSWRPTSMNVTCSAVVEALVVWVTAEVTYASRVPTRIFASSFSTTAICGVERIFVLPTDWRSSSTARNLSDANVPRISLPDALGGGTMGKNCVTCTSTTRSEERRVGKECRSRWSPY